MLTPVAPIKNAEEISAAVAKQPLVNVVDLSKRFVHGNGTIDVLKGITIRFDVAEMISVVGMSGAGKSTLLYILGALDRPSSGQLLFEGRDLVSLSDSELAAFRNHFIGFVFQFHYLLPDFTALENVMMPCLINRVERGEASRRAEALLTKVGLKERLTHRPGELSGGEQQRVALARALVMQPKLLLADEPTGNLDRYTSEAIHDLFFELNEHLDTTMLVVTHNQRLAERMPRQLNMVEGKLIEQNESSPQAHD